MKNNLSKPCNECPFRKNSLPAWLGPWTVETLHRFVMSEQTFACHQTITGEDEEEEKDEADMSICRGSILYMIKNAKRPCYNRELVEAVSKAKSENPDLENILSLPEFFVHHEKIRALKICVTKI